jgi:serine/threonine protein kinase
MTPEHWQKVKSILEGALELPPEERSAFLADSCDGDEELKREVEELLNFEETESDVLELEALSGVIGREYASKSLINQQIGNYKIVGELGTGGMGAVYLAERADGEFQQKVALKLIKRGMDSDAVLQRFINERQILASLEHPNIAHLIDGGTTNDGLPFFVLEYVEGASILQYADEQNLELSARLELFREVCSAVSFAHQNLVIHRDLKPSNILITKDGKVKLLDFGIAKLLKSEDQNQTATQMHVFTPEYASPEQVRGEKLTTASDVYSLGVILYELLTDSRPYETESKNISQIIKAVCESEPVRPSSAVGGQWSVGSETKRNFGQKTNPKSRIPNPRSLKGDLDNIILKALRKEPDRRYSSVEQFSEDVRRHLTGLPVSASSDTWSYRATKFVRRNRYSVAAAGLILITLLAGLFATLYQRNRAQRRFNDVRQIANSFLFEFHDSIKDLPGATPARELVVKRAIEYLDTLAAESDGDPTLQRELATAYSQIGQIQGNSYHSNLGDTDGAMKSYLRSLEIRQKLSDADPKNLEIQHELADSHEGVGDMLYTINDLKAGLESYEKAVTIREKIVAAVPENLEYQYYLANVLGKRGDISGMEGFPNLGDIKTAYNSYQQVVGIYEGLSRSAPDNEKYRLGYATNLNFFGMLQTATGNAKDAIANGQKALVIFDSLIAANPNNAKYETHKMSALVFMRFPLLDEGRTDEAIANGRLVVSIMEKQVAADPKNSFARRSLSVSYNSLGKCLLQAGDAKGAIENHQRALKIAEELAAADPNNGENSRDVSYTKQALAEAQAAAGDSETALRNFRESIATLEARIKTDSSNTQIKDDLAVSLVAVGKILTSRGEMAEAVESFRRAMSFAEEALQKNSSNNRVKARYAANYFEAGKALFKIAQTERNEKTKVDGCGFLNRSLTVWNEMKREGTLSTFNSNRPDEVAKAMVGCS